MTKTLTQTALLTIIVAITLMLPAFSFAASNPEITKLESQFQMLMERFESLKNNRTVNSSSTASSTKPERDKMASSTVNRTCMATAVATREASVKTAWTGFNTSIMSGLDKRSTALIAAWNGGNDGSKDSLKSAWSTWKSDSKAAHSKLRTDRKAAWETFKKTAKDSCKVTVPKEEDTGKEAKDTINL